MRCKIKGVWLPCQDEHQEAVQPQLHQRALLAAHGYYVFVVVPRAISGHIIVFELLLSFNRYCSQFTGRLVLITGMVAVNGRIHVSTEEKASSLMIFLPTFQTRS